MQYSQPMQPLEQSEVEIEGPSTNINIPFASILQANLQSGFLDVLGAYVIEFTHHLLNNTSFRYLALIIMAYTTISILLRLRQGTRQDVSFPQNPPQQQQELESQQHRKQSEVLLQTQIENCQTRVVTSTLSSKLCFKYKLKVHQKQADKIQKNHKLHFKHCQDDTQQTLKLIRTNRKLCGKHKSTITKESLGSLSQHTSYRVSNILKYIQTQSNCRACFKTKLSQVVIKRYLQQCQALHSKSIMESQNLLQLQIEDCQGKSKQVMDETLTYLNQQMDDCQKESEKHIGESLKLLQENTEKLQNQQRLGQFQKFILSETLLEQNQQKYQKIITKLQPLYQTQIQQCLEEDRKSIAESQQLLSTQIMACQDNYRIQITESFTMLQKNEQYQVQIDPNQTEQVSQSQNYIYEFQTESKRKLDELQTIYKNSTQKGQKVNNKHYSDSENQLKILIQSIQDKSRESVKQSQDQHRQKCQQLNEEGNKKIHQSQTLLEAQVKECINICRNNLNQSQTLLQVQIEKCEQQSKNNIAESQNQLNNIIQQCQKERMANTTVQLALLQSLTKLCNTSCFKNMFDGYQLLQTQIQQGYNIYQDFITKQLELLEVSIQQCYVEYKNNCQDQTLIQTYNQQCYQECVRNLAESQNLLQKYILQCFDDFSSIIIQTQNQMYVQILQFQGEAIKNINEQQINFPTMISQFQEKHQSNMTNSQQLLQSQVKICKQESQQLMIKQQSMQTQKPVIFAQSNQPINQVQRADLKSQLNQQIVEHITHLKLNNLIEDPAKYQVTQQVNIQNPEVLFYVLREQFKQDQKNLYKSKEPSKLNIYALQGMFTGDSEDSIAYSVTFQETQQITFAKIQQDINVRVDFERQFIQSLAMDLNIRQEQIRITQIVHGSIKVLYTVTDCSGTIYEDTDLQNLKARFPGTSPTMKLHQLFQTAALNVDDFDHRFNMEWPHESSDFRGPEGNRLSYYFPKGWKGYALKVSGLYGSNDNWLAMDSNTEEWYVLFHGTSFQHINEIVRNKNFDKKIQPYSAYPCMRTPNQTVGKGVYFSNHIEVSEKYTKQTKVGSKEFKIAFQSRVNPPMVRQIKKEGDFKERGSDWNNDYFVVNQSCDIRPYRILLKEVI